MLKSIKKFFKTLESDEALLDFLGVCFAAGITVLVIIYMTDRYSFIY